MLAQRHFNRSEPSLYPLKTDHDFEGHCSSRFPPGPHFRDYFVRCSLAQAATVTGDRQLVPSRSMAQQRTNNLRPTATMAIFLRDFLPPLMR